MSAGSFLGMCYQEASGCRGPPSRPCRKPTESMRPKDIHQSNVHRSQFLSVLLAAQRKKAAGMALGLVQGELKGFKENRPCPFLHPASGLLLCRGLCLHIGGFPTVHSSASLSAGVPGNLPLPHRGPFLVRARGPLSVPETETIPLWPPHLLKRISPHQLCSNPCPLLKCPPLPPHSHSSTGSSSVPSVPSIPCSAAHHPTDKV